MKEKRMIERKRSKIKKRGSRIETKYYATRPDTRHNMHLVCVLFNFENNTGHTD